MTDTDLLRTTISGTVFSNPVWVGSSELSMTEEGIALLAEAGAGAIVAKSVNESPEAHRNLSRAQYMFLRDGRIPQTSPTGLDSALLNRSGLASEDLHGWCSMLASARTACDSNSSVLIGSLTLGDPAEAPRIVGELSEAVSHVEVNVGAPHAREISSGSITNVMDPVQLGELVAQCRTRCAGLLIIKLPKSGWLGPSLTRAAFDAGADAVTLEGRSPGLMVDPESGRPILGSAGAYGSGHDLATSLYAIAKSAEAAEGRPLVGTNGARSGADVMRFLLCGATSVEVVSALVLRGTTYVSTLVDELRRLVERFTVDTVPARSVMDLVGYSQSHIRGYDDEELDSRSFAQFLLDATEA